MLRGVLEELGEMGNLLPLYTGPRCLLVRQAVGGCDACQVACPRAAVQLTAGGYSIEIDPQACTGCGLCVQACPTGALEYDIQGNLEALQDQRQQPEAGLCCSQSGAGGAQVVCLGRMSVAQVAAVGAWDMPLTLIHGDCAACAVGSPEVLQRVQEVVEAAQTMREATGQPAQVTVRPAQEADQVRSLNVSRRGAFAALFRAGQKQVAQRLPERPLPFVDWSEPAERAPREWRWRKTFVRPLPDQQAPIVWPAPLIDDTCIDCPVCANVCPTSAITRELQPEGGVRLMLELGACTGCMACLRSCPPQAIHEQRQWRSTAFEAQLLLRESNRTM